MGVTKLVLMQLVQLSLLLPQSAVTYDYNAKLYSKNILKDS